MERVAREFGGAKPAPEPRTQVVVGGQEKNRRRSLRFASSAGDEGFAMASPRARSRGRRAARGLVAGAGEHRHGEGLRQSWWRRADLHPAQRGGECAFETGVRGVEHPHPLDPPDGAIHSWISVSVPPGRLCGRAHRSPTHAWILAK